MSSSQEILDTSPLRDPKGEREVNEFLEASKQAPYCKHIPWLQQFGDAKPLRSNVFIQFGVIVAFDDVFERRDGRWLCRVNGYSETSKWREADHLFHDIDVDSLTPSELIILLHNRRENHEQA